MRASPFLRGSLAASAASAVSSSLPSSRVSSTVRSASALSRTRRQTASRLRPLVFSCPYSQSQPPPPDDLHRPKSVAGFLTWKPADAVPDVAVHGFVRSVRTMKANSFVALGDGSSLAPLQAVVPAALAEGITNGAAVRLTGSWTPSLGKGQSHELQVRAVEVLGPSDAKTFPIQKKYQSPEFLRTLPHLRARVPFNATLLRFRSAVITSLNLFFARRGFVETHPPLITSSDCEGAGEVFSVAPAGGSSGSGGGSSPSASAKDGDLFFHAPKYLTVSTQLHLEALAQAVGNVWTLSPTFRAEENDTPRHLSEFYMLEAELGFVDRLGGVMDLVEDMLRAVAADHHGSRLYEELLERAAGHGHGQSLAPADDVAQRWQGLLQPDRWPRITYAEAIDRLVAAPVAFAYPPVWDGGLQTEHEKYLAQTVGDGRTPVFVTHYPRAIKAFYMLPSEAEAEAEARASSSSSRADTVDCFDLLVPEFCEIAGGSMREHRLAHLLAAMQSRGMKTPDAKRSAVEDGPLPAAGSVATDLDWYVDLRRWGCPPHGGFGLGFDRLLCYLSGVPTIRDTVAFPRWYGRCDC